MTARRTEPEGSVRWDQGPGEFAGVGDRAPLGTTGGNVFEPVAVRGCLIAGATREISLRVSRAVQTPRLGSQQIAVTPKWLGDKAAGTHHWLVALTQTATSGLSAGLGVIPHDTEVSVRKVAGLLLMPQ
jgi:hypothetical protein